MVSNFWQLELKKAIAKNKIRIQFCERHGIGDTTMKEKFRLKKAERQLELSK